MKMENDRISDVDRLARLARSASEVRTIPNDDNLICVPEGVQVFPRENLMYPGLENTPSINRYENALTTGSFVDFVALYGNENTVVFLDPANGSATSVINYVSSRKHTPTDDSFSKTVLAKKRWWRSSQRDSLQSEADEEISNESVMAYRCDWQISYRPVFSQQWAELNRLPDPATGGSSVSILLTDLKSYFRDSAINEEDDEPVQLHSMDRKQVYATALDADIATSADVVEIIRTQKLPKQRLLLNFILPLFRGGTSSEVILMAGQSGEKINFEILDVGQIIAKAKERNISVVRDQLIKKECNVFYADLSDQT